MPLQSVDNGRGSKLILFVCEGSSGDVQHEGRFGFDANVRGALAAQSREEAQRKGGQWWCAREAGTDGLGYCKETGEVAASKSDADYSKPVPVEPVAAEPRLF